MRHRSDLETLGLMRALFPDLARELDAALDSYGERSPEAEFDAQLAARVSKVLPGTVRFDALDRAAASRFERVFASAVTVATSLGTHLPEPEAFTAAGADFAVLARSMEADSSLVPVPAPYGLGARAWEAAFGAGTDTDTAADACTDTDTGAGADIDADADADTDTDLDTDGPRLLLAAEVVREFAILDVPPANEPAVPTTATGQSRRVHWTLRLVPATPQPPLLGLSHAHGPHVTLPEMLMLQLMRAALGEAPLDTGSFTWLHGPLAEGRLAARHVYDASDHAVRINCREVVSQGPHLGARPPVSSAAV